MKLHYHPLSGHSHRARPLLALPAVPLERVEVEMASDERKSAGFSTPGRLERVPVLVADAPAILIARGPGHRVNTSARRNVLAGPGGAAAPAEFRKAPVGRCTPGRFERDDAPRVGCVPGGNG
jgi:hypothetical protein